MVTVAAMSTALQVYEASYQCMHACMHIFLLLLKYCDIPHVQIQERVRKLVSPHAAMITPVLDFVMSTSEMVKTINVHAT